MSKVLSSATRSMYAKLGAEELKKSRRLRMAGDDARRRFSDAFLATIQTEQVNQRRFKYECKLAGVSPMLIFLLLGIAWDILFYWWTHRDAGADNPTHSKENSMLRFLLAVAIMLTLSVAARAQCPGGVCPRPVRSILAPTPTLAPRARTTVAAPHKHKRVERSVVVRRGHARPGFWARITFRPQGRCGFRGCR